MSFLPTFARLASVLVIVVPTLAPMIIGTAISTGSPPATSPTVMAVVVEEDCISTVPRIPIANPTKGFVANSNMPSAWSPVMRPNPSPMTLTAHTRR